jgi:hypothetical protein
MVVVVQLKLKDLSERHDRINNSSTFVIRHSCELVLLNCVAMGKISIVINRK